MVKADSLLTGNPHWKLCHSVGMGKNLRKGIDQPNVQQHGSACLLLYTQRWYIPASDPKQMGSLQSRSWAALQEHHLLARLQLIRFFLFLLRFSQRGKDSPLWLSP